MGTRDQRREEVLERMADYVLAEGLAAATLRPLAAAANTSDRMLLYYFADKDELLSATLQTVVQRMLVQLDAAVPAGKPRRFPVLLAEVRTVLASDRIKPFMHLWLDLTIGAARGLQPHLKIAGEIADGFYTWVDRRLHKGSGGRQFPSAALFLVAIQGMQVFQAIDRPGIAETAAMEMPAAPPRPRG